MPQGEASPWIWGSAIPSKPLLLCHAWLRGSLSAALYLKSQKLQLELYFIRNQTSQCLRNQDSVVLVSSRFLMPLTLGSCSGKSSPFLHGSVSCSTSTSLTSSSSGKGLGEDDFQACIWEVSREVKVRQKSAVLYVGDECSRAWHQHSHSSSWPC